MEPPLGQFVGIASRTTGKVFDWYPTEAEAEAALAEVLRDEPAFRETSDARTWRWRLPSPHFLS